MLVDGMCVRTTHQGSHYLDRKARLPFGEVRVRTERIYCSADIQRMYAGYTSYGMTPMPTIVGLIALVVN